MSNLPSQRNFAPSTDARGVVLRTAQQSEIHICLRLILGTGGDLASEEQVIDFLRFAMYRGIDLKDIYLVERDGRVVWAILPVASPGRTMVLFSPSQIAPTLQERAAPQLINNVVSCYATRGVHLAQVLIDPGDQSVIRLYQSAGFERLAELLYLNRTLRRIDQAHLSDGLSLLRYSPENHPLFAQTITATYAGSLDCPGLNGRRDIEDVLAGHQAVGHFDPAFWFLLCDQHTPIGVSLLGRSPHSDAVELIYFGLAPAARGRGLGRLLMQFTIHEATQSSARQLTLAVDSRNVPALRLYRKHGLKQVCSRIALLRDLRTAPSSPVQSEPISSRLI